jgi:hypothetical protein
MPRCTDEALRARRPLAAKKKPIGCGTGFGNDAAAPGGGQKARD